MCVWTMTPRNVNGVVIHDERGEWIATTRNNAVASSIVEDHNKNEVNGNGHNENTEIDPALIRWNKPWKR